MRWLHGNPISHVLMGLKRQKERTTGEAAKERATGFSARDDDGGSRQESSKEG